MKRKLLLILLPALPLLLSAQTNVSGGIYTNTTWTKVNSPYIVTDTVVVFQNVVLTIEPGVTIKFDSAQTIEIRGSLKALGTIIDTIHFTSNVINQNRGYWSGIRAFNITDSLNLRYCKFTFAKTAIVLGSGVYALKICKNTSFINNETGIGFNDLDMRVDSCYFEGNITGINAMHIVNECIFINNGVGIYRVWNLSNSFFCGNTNYGVQDVNETIKNCIITNNDIGIGTNNADTTVNNMIYGNRVGLTFYNPSTFYFSNNSICSNRDYNLIGPGAINIALPNNCWCTTDSSEIAAKIYDAFDNLSYGIVDFSTYQVCDTTILPNAQQCTFPGCHLTISTTHTNATCDTCHTGSATAYVTYGSAPITYTWNTSPLQTTQTATGLAPGNYTVCVGDANGCTACHTVFIDSNNCSGFSILSTQATNATCSACNDGSAQVNETGGTPPYSYTWYTSPIQTTAAAVGLPQGTYPVCVSDAYGCVACDTVIVSIGSCSAYFNLYPDTIPHNYLAVNMANGNGPLTYLWNWGDGTTDTGAYPSHTYASAGLYTICLTITDSAGCTNTFCNGFYLMRTTNTMINVNVVPPSTTGISESVSEKLFSVYPNPAHDNFTVVTYEGKPAQLEIFNLLGEKVYMQKLNRKHETINCQQLSAGVYVVRVSDGEMSVTQKLIVE